MRWLLTSWGSQGDLHPFLALGRALRARGHEVTLVGHPEWAADTEGAGLRFVATGEGPRDDVLRRHPEIVSMDWGGLRSLRVLIAQGMEPSFEPMLAALLAEAPRHDVIIAHHFVFSAPVAAELSGKPLVTVSLAPGVTPSAYARPGSHFGHSGNGVVARALNRLIWQGGRLATEILVDPVVNKFRRRHGLAAIRGNVFDAPSAHPSLALYSSHFAPRPPDWSAAREPTGFCFYDPPSVGGLPQPVQDFLAAGEAPVLFTLGSSVVKLPGLFYRSAVDILTKLNLRGILLVGSEENRPAHLSANILALPYAPYGLIMPQVRAVVHQCGVGTLSHTLRAGVPTVGCPFAFDQPNNASRLKALGAAEVVLPHQRTAAKMGRALQRLLSGEAPRRAKELGELIRQEDGPARACEILERNFSSAV